MDSEQALAAFAALSQDTRLQIFRLLIRAGAEGMAAGEIAGRLSVLPNTLSTHLGILVHAGLLRRDREGRSLRYMADLDGVRALLGFLMEDCCGGEPERCRPLIDAIACQC